MKPIDYDNFFNIKVIIIEMEYSSNDDEAIKSSVVPEVETGASVVSEVVQESDITVVEVGEIIEATVVSENQNKESSMNLEKTSANIRPIDEVIEDYDIPVQHNEASAEAGIFPE